jgi:hypothetical protein
MVYYSAAFVLILSCVLMIVACRAGDRFEQTRKQLATTRPGDSYPEALSDQGRHENTRSNFS